MRLSAMYSVIGTRCEVGYCNDTDTARRTVTRATSHRSITRPLTWHSYIPLLILIFIGYNISVYLFLSCYRGRGRRDTYSCRESYLRLGFS